MFLTKRTMKFIYRFQFLQMLLSSVFWLVILQGAQAKEFPLKAIGVIITVSCIFNTIFLIYLGILGIKRNRLLPVQTKKTLGTVTSWFCLLGIILGWLPLAGQLVSLGIAILAIISIFVYKDTY